MLTSNSLASTTSLHCAPASAISWVCHLAGFL